jgi:hypothetical protein
MFQAELGRMIREEQQKDYRREARHTRLASVDCRPHRDGAHGWVVLPLFLMAVVSRLMEFSSHAVRQ